ncbi:MAG: Lrp/AsnC family transcriptional regulator [Rhodothalassiaceae bacterium]
MLKDDERTLLAALQCDGRLSIQELAERVHMSASTCWRKIRALEQRGVITGYAALVDPEKVGLMEAVFVHVRLEKHVRMNTERFMEVVLSRPEVQECYATTGDEDYVLKVLASDMRAYRRFLEDVLMQMPYIDHIRSNVVLRTIKRDPVIAPEIMPAAAAS